MKSSLLPTNVRYLRCEDVIRVLDEIAVGTLRVEVELDLMGIDRSVLWKLIRTGYVIATCSPLPARTGTALFPMPEQIEPKALTHSGMMLLHRLRYGEHYHPRERGNDWYMVF